MPLHAATSAVFKRLQKISSFPATNQVFQRQPLRVSTGGQPVIVRLVWSEAAKYDVVTLRRGWEWMLKW
jgi:uncharacterized protein (DUF58 family)